MIDLILSHIYFIFRHAKVAAGLASEYSKAMKRFCGMSEEAIEAKLEEARSCKHAENLDSEALVSYVVAYRESHLEHDKSEEAFEAALELEKEHSIAVEKKQEEEKAQQGERNIAIEASRALVHEMVSCALFQRAHCSHLIQLSNHHRIYF